MNLPEREREILLWLRAWNNFSLFPREVGKKRNGQVFRKVVGEVDFWDYVDKLRKDIYANIFSQRQKVTRLYDTILIDVDYHSGHVVEDIERSYDYYLKIKERLDDAGLKTRDYFTGRGFHIYIDFPLTRLEFYPKVVRKYIGEILRDSEGVDFHVLGDRNRMARLVGSIHGMSDLMVIRFVDEDLDSILERSKEGFVGCNKKVSRNGKSLSQYLRNLDEKISEKYGYSSDAEGVDIDINILAKDLPPCIQNGIKILKETGELVHRYRLHLAAYLLRIWPYEKVVDVFKMANDFNINITEYQLNNIMERDLWPLSCKNAARDGICPYGERYKACPFYELSDGWLGRLLRGEDNDS